MCSKKRFSNFVLQLIEPGYVFCVSLPFYEYNGVAEVEVGNTVVVGGVVEGNTVVGVGDEVEVGNTVEAVGEVEADNTVVGEVEVDNF